MKKKIHFFVRSVLKIKMSVKRKLNTKNLKEKCDILSHIEKGMTNKEAGNKLGVPKNTISTQIKNKEKIFQSLEESARSTKKLRGCQYEKVNKALFEWFVLQRSQNIPIDGSMIQEKGLFFAKKLEIVDFRASDGWIDSGKKARNNLIHILNLFSGFL